MDNNLAWLEKLSDSKSNIKQDARKRGLLCVISASTISANEGLSCRRMPLKVSNALPGSDI